jgi:putative oxidoreductase
MDQFIYFSPLIARVLVGFFFVFFGVWNLRHWQPTLNFMRQKKLPFAAFLLSFGILLQSIAGILIISGWYVPLASLALIPFVLISVFIFHAFWTFEGEARLLNMIIFITNLCSTLAALLLLINVH